jgi:ABC-type transport system involved in multi-copper enzyme maturation permease subunit
MAAPEPDSAGIPAALARVRCVAAQTLTEAVRLRLAGLLAAAGAIFVLLALWLREFNFGGAELKFIAEFGAGAISLLGTLLAATATAHLFFRDVEGGLAAVVLTRATRRGEYLAGKLAGVAALLALFVTALGLLLGCVLLVRGAQLGATAVPLPVFLQACALVWLKLTLVGAMTLLICSYAGSELFAVCAGLMVTLVAHLRPFTTAEGWAAWLRLWPNLGLFDAGELLAGTAAFPGELGGLFVYWAGFVVLFSALAVYVFRRREF